VGSRQLEAVVSEHDQKDTAATRFIPRRGVPALLAAACALLLIGAAVAVAGQLRGRDTDPPRAWSRDSGRDVESGRDVVTVRGTRCPSGHPHRIGLFSSESSTQVDGREVEHRQVHRVRCSR
jgi:hypothetical protein